MSILQHEVDIRREIVVPGKYDMSALILALTEVKIKAEDIPVRTHQGKTATKQLKDNGDIPTVMVHAGHINKTTTL